MNDGKVELKKILALNSQFQFILSNFQLSISCLSKFTSRMLPDAAE